MVSNDVQDELAEGFEPSALPPVGPDGALELPPMQKPPRHPPRLCEQGPCRNYHTFKIQLDAAKPLPVRREDGTMELPDAPDHEERHHYCYPSVGIESKLGSLPVIQCNRWSPLTAGELAAEEQKISEWQGTAAGQAFLAELAAYNDEQARLEQEAADAATEAADDLAAMPVSTCELGIEVLHNRTWRNWSCVIHVPWDATLQFVRDRALKDAGVSPEDVGQYGIVIVTKNAPPRMLIHPGAVDSTTTISQAGLSSGDRLLFTTSKESQ